MAHWFVTTGRSVFDSSRCWKFLPKPIRQHDDKSDLELLRQPGLAQWLPKLYTERSRHLEQADHQIEGIVGEHFAPCCWDAKKFRALPAEMATLLWLCQPVENDQDPTIQTGDTIHLIQGESNKQAALYLKHMLERCKNPDGLGKKVRPLPDVTIETMGPFALDPKEQQGFENGFSDMWRAITERIGGGGPADARFVLTGGYKAVLLGLALKISGYQGVQTRIYYSHEEATQSVIRIGYTADGKVSALPVGVRS